jgi:hypothetical protein
MPERAAILISCLKEEADQIRDRASRDHRPVSSYLLKITMRWVQFEERLYVDFTRFRKLDRTVFVRHVALPRGPRTTILLRCSAEESKRIRRAAERRGTTISGFIRQCLRRTWHAAENVTYQRLSE